MNAADAIVKKTLREMREDPLANELSPKNIALYATGRTDLPITEQDAEHAMQRKLGQELQKIDLGGYIEEYGEEVLEYIRKTMTEQHIEHPLQNASDFNKVPWTEYGYTSLEAVHLVLYIHGAPNLLYNQ